MKIVGLRERSSNFDTVMFDCSSIESARSLSSSLFFIFFYFLAKALFSSFLVSSSMLSVRESYFVLFTTVSYSVSFTTVSYLVLLIIFLSLVGDSALCSCY